MSTKKGGEKTLVIGARGFIVSHLKSALDSKKTEYVSSSEGSQLDLSRKYQNVIVVSAPTRNSKDFSSAYQQHLRIQQMVSDVMNANQSARLLLFGSIGVCNYTRTGVALNFQPSTKESSVCTDDYQFWKVRQLEDNKNFSPDILHLPIVVLNRKQAADYSRKHRVLRKILYCEMSTLAEAVHRWISDGVDYGKSSSHMQTLLYSGTCYGSSWFLLGQVIVREVGKYFLQHRNWRLLLRALEFHACSQQIS